MENALVLQFQKITESVSKCSPSAPIATLFPLSPWVTLCAVYTVIAQLVLI